jgi:hexosaminidase
MMLDTARTFYPIKKIRKLIRSMKEAKLNVLHLHLSDGDTFSLEIKSINGL